MSRTTLHLKLGSRIQNGEAEDPIESKVELFEECPDEEYIALQQFLLDECKANKAAESKQLDEDGLENIKYESVMSNTENSNHDDDDWMKSFAEWSISENITELNCSDEATNTSEEAEETDIFQNLFLDGISLRKEVVKEIVKIDGVLSVGWGYSHGEEGEDIPTIRVSVVQDGTSTSADQLLEKIVANLCRSNAIQSDQAAVVKNFIKLTDFTSKGSNNVQNFQSHPGSEFQTTYDPSPNPVSATFTGHIHAEMKIKIQTLDPYLVSRYYPVVPLHCILPAKNQQQFCDKLPDITLPMPNLKQLTKPGIDGDINIPKLKHTQEGHQMPTMLKTTVYPEKIKKLMDEMEESHNLRYTVLPDHRLQGYLTGCAGLIEFLKKDEKSCSYIVPEYSKLSPIPFFTHPCNMDIAALKPSPAVVPSSYHEVIKGIVPRSKIYGFPTHRKHFSGSVVALNRNEFILLSTTVLSVEFWIDEHCFPCIQWKLDDQTEDELSIHSNALSGSPVFIRNSADEFRFVGGLYSKQTAFSAMFSLQLIRPEICRHFIEEATMHFTDLAENDRDIETHLQDLRDVLHQLKKVVEHSKKEQSTRWTDKIPFHRLGKTLEGSVFCSLKYYTH